MNLLQIGMKIEKESSLPLWEMLESNIMQHVCVHVKGGGFIKANHMNYSYLTVLYSQSIQW